MVRNELYYFLKIHNTTYSEVGRINGLRRQALQHSVEQNYDKITTATYNKIAKALHMNISEVFKEVNDIHKLLQSDNNTDIINKKFLLTV